MANLDERIDAFKKRIEVDGRDFCEELFKYATVRLLAFKYSYYVLFKHIVEDAVYDGEEESWFVMGRALGHLKDDERSPCIDFDDSHPLVGPARELALKLPEKRG